MFWCQRDMVIEPSVPIAPGYDQLGQFLGAHLNTVDLNCRELLISNVVDSPVNTYQLGMGPVDRTLEHLDLMPGQFRIDLRDPVLDRFDGSLELPYPLPVAGK